MRIGILALQGDFTLHAATLEAAGFTSQLIKQAEDVAGLDGLLLPGGESTTQLNLLLREKLWEVIDYEVRQGLPVFATCAGAILAAAKTQQPQQRSFGWLPITVERNAYGDQRHSFERQVRFHGSEHRLVFIRAPKIVAYDAEKVQVNIVVDGLPVFVEYRNQFVTTFHPELSEDPFFYHYAFNRMATTRAQDQYPDHLPSGCSS